VHRDLTVMFTAEDAAPGREQLLRQAKPGNRTLFTAASPEPG
jgi:hypothetical protein